MPEIEEILDRCKCIAVVGLSPNPERESYAVASYLKNQGYRIIPVNPNANKILGERCYPDLASVPDAIDVVDIFRKSSEVDSIVDEAMGTGAWAIWMQKGVVNERAATKARDGGLLVVMDECMECEVQARLAADD